MTSKSSVVSLLLTLVCTVVMIVSSHALAAVTIFVDAADGTGDGGGCGTVVNPCNTIQNGVNNAAGGDTVQVAAGTYTETVVVNKSLTLLGAQSGVDARTRSAVLGTESLVNGPAGGFNITSNDVVINGFQIEGASASGVKVSGPVDGAQILNNIFRHNVLGLYFNEGGNFQTVRFNRFDSNNTAGMNSGIGIYSDAAPNLNTLNHVEIDNNEFTGQITASIFFNGFQLGITMSNNQIVNDSPILLFHVTTPKILGNKIEGSNGDAVRIIEGVDGTIMSCNTIKNNAGSALRVAGGATAIDVTNNNIEGNLFGIKVDAGVYGTAGGNLDARNNWWGSATGPNDLQGGNPGGTGDKVDDPDEIIDYVPFNTAPIADTDDDGELNTCDTDDDNDTILDASDNCPLTPNTHQEDWDNDGIGDACDPPENKDQCKNVQWENFIFPRRFKNQGDCIQFVNVGF